MEGYETQNMRILYIAEGLDRSEHHMIRAVQNRGNNTYLLLPQDNPLYASLLDQGVRVEPCTLRSRLDVRGIRKIRDMLQSNEIELVHCLRNNRPIANTLMATRGRPTPTVCYRGTMGNLHNWDPGSRLTYLSARIDRIIAVSHSVRQDLLTLGLPTHKIVTIHKGHDIAWYCSDSQMDLTTLGIPANAFVVGCVANMRPLKGVDVLVRALDHLTTSRDVHLLLIGEVRDHALEMLIQQPRYVNRVHAIGYRIDAATLLGACHVCCMPSLRREGLPRAVIEGMSQAVPALVSAIGGMTELVEDGVSGRVVPAGDAQALATVISTWAEDEKERLRCGKNAKLRIANKFSVEHTVKHTLALYQEMLKP